MSCGNCSVIWERSFPSLLRYAIVFTLPSSSYAVYQFLVQKRMYERVVELRIMIQYFVVTEFLKLPSYVDK